MKIKIIILLSIFRIFLFEQYYLIDGVDKNITHSSSDNYKEYYFYTQVEKSKNVKFTVKIPNGCKLDDDLYIYEYESSRSRDYIPSRHFIGKMVNNICVYYYSYTVLSPRSKYVAFKTEAWERSSFEKNIITFRIDLVYEEYDLYNRQPLDLFNLAFNYSYYLYLEIFETINISFIINNITQEPFSNISIQELAERNNTRINIINKPIIFKTDNNQSIASFSYSTNSNYTKYIVLHIKPSFNISQMTAEFDYSVTTIDINDGIWKTIDNIISNEIYLFFIEVTETAKINISLIINDTNNKYDEYELPIIFNNGSIAIPSSKNIIPYAIGINVYEYEKRNNSYTSFIEKNYKIIYNQGSNFFKIPKSFKVNLTNTSYLAFSFKTNYNYQHISANINISGGLFDLFNNTSKNMAKLRPDGDYLFFIKSSRFNYIRLTLTMEDYLNQTINPFSYLNSSELSEKGYYKSYKTNERSISPIINGQQILISQNVTDYSTNYMFFQFKPSYYIESMNIKVYVVDCLLDLDNYKYSKGIYSLKNHYIYYIKMNAWLDHTTKLKLKLYNMNNKPFSFIEIHECFYPYFVSQWKKNITKKIKFKKNKNNYELTYEKKNNLNKHLFLFIEFIPEYDINYMIAETTISKTFRADIATIIVIIIEIIIFILLVLCIINHFKKCKLLKSKDTNLDPNNLNEIIRQN